MEYHLEILVDDEFDASNLRGIFSINGSNAIIDEIIFKGNTFYKPVLEIVKNDLSEISKEKILEIGNLLSDNIKVSESNYGCHYDINFEKNNVYDLDKISLDDSNINCKRLLIQYHHCPINNFYLIEEGLNKVKIIVSPFTKNYFTISDLEWCDFINYLDKNYNIQRIREDKLNFIFKDDNDLDLPTSNIIRKLKFIDDNEPEYRNSFLSNILSYYKKYRKLSEKQIKKCFELI